MRKLWIIAFLPLMACATEEAPVDQSAVNAAQQAWFACLKTKAVSEDDGRSDAGTVAMAVKGLCEPQYRQMWALTGLAARADRVRSYDPMTVALEEQKQEQFQLQLATDAVLLARRRK